jgi:hypothetical protein
MDGGESRDMKKLALLLMLLACISASFALFATVKEPVSQTLYVRNSMQLGNAGPGQTIYLVVDRGTDGGNCPNDYCTDGWDTVVATKLPSGWLVEPSPYYENPMKVKIKIAPDAYDGQYNLTLVAVDEGNYNGLGNMTFYAIVNVSRDVFEISVDPTRVETGVGQPALYNIRIRNTGAASDPFEIKAREGDLPAWNFKKSVLVNYGSERVIPYEVVLDEENVKVFNIEVTSLSSPLINKDMSVVIDSKSSLVTDWKATTHGVLIFPALEQLIYGLVGLLSGLL